MKKNLLLFIFLLSIHFAYSQEKIQNENKEIPARVYFKDGKLNFATENNKFRLWLDNRIYIDAAYYSPSKNIDGLSSKANKDLETDDGIFRFNNGVSIRRARFALKAELWEKWFAEFDLRFCLQRSGNKRHVLGLQIQ